MSKQMSTQHLYPAPIPDKHKQAIVYPDSCFTEAYAVTFEEMENGKAEHYLYESPNGKISHTFIKRVIPLTIGNEDYYDIITPYGYGGPTIIESRNKEALLEEYFTAFHDYCLKNNIVSEFIRFHLLENTDVRERFYGETLLSNAVICKNLMKPVDQDIEPRLIKDVKKAENYGLTVDFDYSGSTQMEFLNMYIETMNRNHAASFYYIDQSFLTKLQKNLEGKFLYAHARLNGEVIASRLVICNEKYGYYFLGGNSKDHYNYKNGTFLDYNLLIELKAKGIEYYIFGGGHKGNDGIYRYKKKFDKKGELPFYIGKKVHMEKEYRQLVCSRKAEGGYDPDTLFFPRYRAPIDK